ncbi:MAG TPA: LLM class flavin-dependent oxidoreductase [Verrucomicrobiae bacterium]|jgi:probable F420-dependent oxidoreductase|nr:LLM class flavin-dependent oxidoreductase [Verrucomicrobiae bacterium]
MPNIGFCMVSAGPQITSDHVVKVARKVEEIGLHSMWALDRVVYDNLEPLTLLSAAAAVTSKIRLGTSVLLAALRPPAALAKTVATLDFLSNGRVTLGIGFGSRENDFTAIGVPFEHRGGRAEEQITLMKRLWTEEKVTHKGKYFHIENVTIGPRPAQKPHPPIWTGGGADAALKRAGRIADGFICGSSSIPEFPSIWEKIAGYAKAAGRDPNKIAKAGLTFMAIDNDKKKAVAACEAYLTRYYGKVRFDVEKVLLVGSPEACAEKIRAAFKNGLDTLIIGGAVPDLRQLDILGEKVLPLLK